MIFDRERKIFLKFLVLAIAVLSLTFFLGKTAHAYSVQEYQAGAPAPTAWGGGGYAGHCNNDFWSDGSHICDAQGFDSAGGYTLTAVNLYNVQCDIASSATMDFKVVIRKNSDGSIQATSDYQTINCVGSPPVGSDNFPLTTFTFPTPYAMTSAFTYAFSIETSATFASNTAHGRGNGGWALDTLSGSGEPINEVNLVLPMSTTTPFFNPSEGAFPTPMISK